MLQQSSVKQVAKTFFPKFIAKFPDIETLAKAKWPEVFPVWRGLGTYSKGKNILRLAKEITSSHNSEFPDAKSDFEKLPGATPTIVKTVLTLAHNKPEALLNATGEKLISILWPDTNIKEKAHELILQAKSPTSWNNALRDLCAELKTGKKIDGELGALINYKIKHLTTTTPRNSEKQKKKKIRKFRIEVGAACILRDGKYLIQTRPAGKSFVGQWEFPGGKREKGETFEQCVKREIQEEIGVEINVKPFFCEILQEFERTELLLRFHQAKIISGDPIGKEGQELRWIEPKKFHGLPFLNTNAQCVEMLKKMHS